MKKILILFLLTDKFLCVNDSEDTAVPRLGSLQELPFNKTEVDVDAEVVEPTLQETLDKSKEIGEKASVLQAYVAKRLDMNKNAKNLGLVLNGESIVEQKLCDFETTFNPVNMQTNMQGKRIKYFGGLERFFRTSWSWISMQQVKQKKKSITESKEYAKSMEEYTAIPNPSAVWNGLNDIKAIGLSESRIIKYACYLPFYFEGENLSPKTIMNLQDMSWGDMISNEYVEPNSNELSKFNTEIEFLNYVNGVSQLHTNISKKKYYMHRIPFQISDFRKYLISSNQSGSLLLGSTWLDNAGLDEINEDSKTAELQEKFTKWIVKSGMAKQEEINEQKQIGSFTISEMVEKIRKNDFFLLSEKDIEKLEKYAENYIITSKKINVNSWSGNEFKKSANIFELTSGSNKVPFRNKLDMIAKHLFKLDNFTLKNNSDDVGNSKLGEMRTELFKDDYVEFNTLLDTGRSVVLNDNSMEATLVEAISSLKYLMPDNANRNFFITINKSFIVNALDAFSLRYGGKLIKKKLPKNLVVEKNPGQKFIAFENQHLPFESSSGNNSDAKFMRYCFYGKIDPHGKLGIHSGPGLGKTTATQSYAINTFMFNTFGTTPWAEKVTIDPERKDLACVVFLKNRGEMQQQSKGITLSGSQNMRLKTEGLVNYIAESGERAVVIFDEVFSSGDNRTASRQMEQSNLQNLLKKDRIAIIFIEHNKSVLEENADRTIVFDLTMSSSAANNSGFHINSANLTPTKVSVDGQNFKDLEEYLAYLETKKSEDQVVSFYFKIASVKEGKKLIPLNQAQYQKMIAKNPKEYISFNYSIKNEVFLKESFDDGIGGKGIVDINPMIFEFQFDGAEAAVVIPMTMKQKGKEFEFAPKESTIFWEFHKEMSLEKEGLKEICGFDSLDLVLSVTSSNKIIIKLFSDKINKISEENIRRYFQNRQENQKK